LARLFLPAVPAIIEPQIRYIHDPEIGYVFQPNQVGYILAGRTTINSLGLRGPEPVSPKPAGHYRLLAVGDSITAGWGVHDDETFCAQLERQLREAFPHRSLEVVNGGVSGYDTVQEERLLRRFVPRLEPDVILVGFYLNDLPYGVMPPDGEIAGPPGANALTLTAGETHRMTPDMDWLSRIGRQSRLLQSCKDILRSIKYGLGFRDYLYNALAWDRAVLEGKQSGAIEDAWRKVEASFADTRCLAEAHGCRVAIVAFPCREQVRKDYPKARYQTRIQEIGERLGMLVIDPLPRFVAQRSRLNEVFLPYDLMHPGPLGHRLVADTILEALRTSPQWLEPSR
jgi:lysophospholipase L1-like esterase